MIIFGPRYKKALRLRTLFWKDAKPLAKKQWREWRIFIKKKPRYKFFSSKEVKLNFFPEKLQKNTYRTGLHLKQKLSYFYGKLKHRSMKKAIDLGLRKQKLESRIDTALYRYGYSLSFRQIRQWTQHKQVLSLGKSSNIYYPKIGFAHYLLKQGESLQNLETIYKPYIRYFPDLELSSLLWKDKSNLSKMTKITNKKILESLWNTKNLRLYNRLIYINYNEIHKIYPFRLDYYRLYKFYRGFKVKS